MDRYARLSFKQIQQNHGESLIDESELTDDTVENASDRFATMLSAESIDHVTVQKVPARNCKLKVLVAVCGSGIIIGLALILHFYTNHAKIFNIGDKSVGTAELNLSEKTLKILDGEKNIKLKIMLAGSNYHTLSSNFQKCSDHPMEELCITWLSYGTTLKVGYFTPKLNTQISSTPIIQQQCFEVSWTYNNNRKIEDCVYLDDKRKTDHPIWFDTTKYLLWPRQQNEVCTSSCYSLITGWNDTTRQKVERYKSLGSSIIEPLWVSSDAISIKASMQYSLQVCEKLCKNSTLSTLCLSQHKGINLNVETPSDSRFSYTVCTSASTLHPSIEMDNLLSLGRTDSLLSNGQNHIYKNIVSGPNISTKKNAWHRCNTLFTKPLWNIEFNKKEYDAETIERELVDLKEIGGTATFQNISKVFANVGDFCLRNDSVINFSDFLRSVRNMGFKIMLPVSPFVNYDSDNFHHALKEGFLIKNRFGAPVLTSLAMLGNNIYPGIIDLTNSNAFKWFAGNMDNLKNQSSIDYLHLYYGQEVWLPDQYLLKNHQIGSNFYSKLYVNSVQYIDACPVTDVAFSSHSDNQIVLLNAATGLEGTLKLALATGIAGYPFFIPNLPFRLAEASMLNPKTLEDGFIRWIQLVSMFPVAHMPWDYHHLSRMGVNITNLVAMVKKCMDVRQDKVVGQALADAFSAAEGSGSRPIVAPMWMADGIPQDSTDNYRKEMVFNIQDQFMIGKDVFVAPILQMGHRERTIYFPPGQWCNVLKPTGNPISSNGKVWLKHYRVALSDIMVFKRQPTPTLSMPYG